MESENKPTTDEYVTDMPRVLFARLYDSVAETPWGKRVISRATQLPAIVFEKVCIKNEEAGSLRSNLKVHRNEDIY